MFFFEDIKTGPDNYSLLHPHVSIHRSTSGVTRVFEDRQTYFSNSNLLGIFIITFYNKGAEEEWINTQIQIDNGSISAKNQKMKSVFGLELNRIMAERAKSENETSEPQKNIITKRTSVSESEKHKTQYLMIYAKIII